jgi:hypothetical protein
MTKTIDPFRLLLIAAAGRMNQQQQDVIVYLREENPDSVRTTRHPADTVR